jgi:hypothetical protein
MTEASYILEKLNELASKDDNGCCGCSKSIEYEFKKIQKIDDLKVIVKLRATLQTKNKQWQFRYYITPNFSLDYSLYHSPQFNGVVEERIININLVQEVLDDLKKNLKVMKLDVFGKLSTELCLEEFDEYLDADKCCVCFDITTTKTDCRHHLCLGCWGKMKKDKCPMCRKKYPRINGTESESESESDDEE